MAKVGLFTREDLKKGPVRKPPKLELTPERLQQMGLKGVRSMNPNARHPEMKPSGVKNPLVYVLGEAPGEHEDIVGKPFIGKSGQVLRENFPEGYKDIVRINNCVRTRPPGNRTPTYVEIECFRKSVEEDIEQSKPAAILGVGFIPLTWMLGLDAPKIRFSRGRRFPVQIGSHKCWFYPTYHPSYISRVRNARELIDDVPGTEIEKVFISDVHRCFDEAGQIASPKIEDPEKLYEDVQWVTGRPGDLKTVQRFLKKIETCGKLAYIDLETDRRRPYGPDSKILTASVTGPSGLGTLAFPISHPQSSWSGDERKEVQRAFRDLLCSSVPRAAHSATFEMEWLAYHYGNPTIEGDTWHCTQAQCYVLDERTGKKKGEGTQNLNFLTQLQLGIQIKTFSDVDRGNLAGEPLVKVLKYNSLDTKYGRKLFYRQKALLVEEGLEDVYRIQRQRMPCFVMAQLKGLPVNQKKRQELQDAQVEKIKSVDWEIDQCRSVRRYRKRYGAFDPGSNLHLVKMFRDFLGRDEGIREDRNGKVKYSTDEDVLSKMKDEPLAALVLKRRNLIKMKGTYLDPLDPAFKKTVVHPDGRIHSQYKIAFTSSSRTSAEDPPVQTWPKRKHVWVREPIQPNSDETLIASDYGALEFRGVAMHSRDEKLVDMMWTDYDVHMAWTKRIVELYPKIMKIRHEDKDEPAAWKALRNEVKNELVFPACYGSSERSIVNSLDIPDRIGHTLFEEFWDLFKGVKKWHKRLKRFYEEHGYVQGLTGRRRHGPLSPSMVINSPVQGDGADITCDAMARLYNLSVEKDLPWLSPMLNIHDDLTFVVPRKHAEQAIHLIVPEMCKVPFKWVNVPMQVEISMGPDWAHMKEIGKFRSNTLKQLRTFRLN